MVKPEHAQNPFCLPGRIVGMPLRNPTEVFPIQEDILGLRICYGIERRFEFWPHKNAHGRPSGGSYRDSAVPAWRSKAEPAGRHVLKFQLVGSSDQCAAAR